MRIIVRAILSGFGYKIGAELGRYVSERIGLSARKSKETESDVPPEGAVEDKKEESSQAPE